MCTRRNVYVVMGVDPARDAAVYGCHHDGWFQFLSAQTGSGWEGTLSSDKKLGVCVTGPMSHLRAKLSGVSRMKGRQFIGKIRRSKPRVRTNSGNTPGSCSDDRLSTVTSWLSHPTRTVRRHGFTAITTHSTGVRPGRDRGALVVPRLRPRRTPLRPTGPAQGLLLERLPTAGVPLSSRRSIAITVRRRRRYNGRRAVNVRTPCASPTRSSADDATPPVARSRCAARSPDRRARGEAGTSGSCQMFPGHVARARNSVA